jgi:hypothetical protein
MPVLMAVKLLDDAVKGRITPGTTPLLTRTLPNVAADMSLQVLAYNFKRVLGILGIARTGKRCS